MSKYIYVHIGMGKTGTTTLQYGLRDNYEHLLKHGWLYPKAGRHQQEGSVHHNVAFDIRGDPRFVPTEGGLRELVKEIEHSPKQNIIISSEVFTKETILTLHKTLSPIGLVKIVVYFRRQVDAFQSLWSQQVKTCETVEPFEFWARNRNANGNYFGYINEWAKVFGKENILVRPLEAGQMHGHILEDFLFACGFEPLEGLSLPTNKNISPGVKTLEAIRFFTRRFGVATPPLGDHYSYQISRMITNYAAQAGWDKERPKLVSRELAEEIEKKYEEMNNKVARVYLKQDRLFLQEPNYGDSNDFSIDDFPPREVFRMSAYLLKRLEMNPQRIPSVQALLSENQNGLFHSAVNWIKRISRLVKKA